MRYRFRLTDFDKELGKDIKDRETSTRLGDCIERVTDQTSLA